MKALRIAAPWAVGLTIVAVLLLRVDPRATLDALAAGDAGYLPLSLAFIGIWLVLDAGILSWLFSCTEGSVSLREMAWLRAATYPMLVVSFHLASAALATSLARALDRPLTRIAGGLLLYYLADVAALASLAFGASLWLTSDSAGYLRLPLALVALVVLGLLLAGRRGRGLLRQRALVEVLGELTYGQIARLVSYRLAFHLSFAAFVWLGAARFGVELPALEAVARTPLVLAVAALPIAPAGVGTAQAAILWLFAPYASQAKLMAFGLAYGFTLVLLRLPVGIVAWWIMRSRRSARRELTV